VSRRCFFERKLLVWGGGVGAGYGFRSWPDGGIGRCVLGLDAFGGVESYALEVCSRMLLTKYESCGRRARKRKETCWFEGI
jgi:hypothetical protein